MNPPPPTLDGARVLKVANLASARPTGQTRHYVGNERVSSFASIALTRYGDDPRVYIFYCDAEWNVVTDTLHNDLADAEAQAHIEFEGLDLVEAP